MRHSEFRPLHYIAGVDYDYSTGDDKTLRKLIIGGAVALTLFASSIPFLTDDEERFIDTSGRTHEVVDYHIPFSTFSPSPDVVTLRQLPGQAYHVQELENGNVRVEGDLCYKVQFDNRIGMPATEEFRRLPISDCSEYSNFSTDVRTGFVEYKPSQ